MKRLTYRDENGWVGVHNLDNTVSPTSVAIHKLAEFEDFMEEQRFESLEDLKRYISQSIKAGLIINKKIQENKVLEKALELACDKVRDNLEWFYDFKTDKTYYATEFEKAYKNIAEKEVNNDI